MISTNTKYKYLSILFLFIFVTFYSKAQTCVITGRVTDSKGQILQGVSIISSVQKNGTVSDQNGSFSLNIQNSTSVRFSGVGYMTQEITVTTCTHLEVKMQLAEEELEQIVFVGNRGGGRIKTETPVPVDVIKLNQLGLYDAKPNLTSMLNIAAPSFNYNKMSGSDGADHIDLGTLRGLGPDQTLVLINGKRRHQTAFIGLFGTRGRGNSGTDLNGFPENAVDRVEILRDGASAQYGSDAMAGVINVILKKNTGKWNIDQGFSFFADPKFNASNHIDPTQYYTGSKLDGKTYSFNADNGWNIGKKGILHLAVQYQKRDKTFRQVPDTNVLTNANALPINKTRRAFGESSLEAWSTMMNFELPIDKKKTVLYSFGGITKKFGDSYAFTRNASSRPDRFPVDNTGKIIFLPAIMKKTSDGEIFYNPHNQAKITDWSAVVGLKGVFPNHWRWDLSNTMGQNDFHFYGDQTFNASLINQPQKTHFDDGGMRFFQHVINFDINKTFDWIGKELNVSMGTEIRNEKYSIYAGEEASYKGYTNAFGQSAGAQGFPGFSLSDVIKGKRTSMSLFLDADLQITKGWLMSIASRIENFSDFGFVSTGKIATSVKLGSNVNWRGSISTGFRAPSLQQTYFNNTITSFSFGQLVQNRIASNIDPITRSAGIPLLKEENGINFSTGWTAKIMQGLRITLDGYAVKIYDRIVLSGVFSSNDPTLSSAFKEQLKSIDVSSAQFFANAVNTTNLGLDFVVDYTKKWENRTLKMSLTGNFNKVKIDAIHIPSTLNDSYIHRKSFFSDREEQFLKASAPASKIVSGIELQLKKWSIGLREVYFGRVQTLGFGWTGLASQRGTNGPGDPAISGGFLGIDPYVDIDGYRDGVHVLREIFNYSAKFTTDLYGGFKISKVIHLGCGIDNIFNVHPDYANVPQARYQSFVNETGGAWESVQMGFNGTRYYTKIKWIF